MIQTNKPVHVWFIFLARTVMIRMVMAQLALFCLVDFGPYVNHRTSVTIWAAF